MFRLSFNTDNDQFTTPCPNHAVADILREVARKVANGRNSGNILDKNGNDIGEYEFKMNTRCMDCGEWGEMTGHMTCQYPQDR